MGSPRRRDSLTWVAAFVLNLGLAGGLGAGTCPLPMGYQDFGTLNEGPRDVAVVGNRAFTADLHGLTAFDIADPAKPRMIGKLLLPEPAWGIAVSGEVAYVADYMSGLQIIDISDPTAPRLIAGLDLSSIALDIAVAGGLAYIAAHASLQIVDVSDPSEPTLVVSYDTPGYAYGVAVSGTTAYVADYASGLQILDVSDPEHPTLLGGQETPGNAWTVTVSGSTAYLGGSNNSFHILDVSDPTSPVLLGSYQAAGLVQAISVSGTAAYVAAYDGGLQIIDVSDPSSPAVLASFDTPGNVVGLALSGTILFVADETSLQVIDVSDPSNPGPMGTLESPGHAWRLTVSGKLAYVADRTAGLQVLDISDPLAPLLLGGCTIPGEDVFDVAVENGLAYLASSTGLQIIDVSEPSDPRHLSSLAVSQAMGVGKAGNYVYLALAKTLPIVDVSDPNDPVQAGSLSIPSIGRDVAVSGTTAFVASHHHGLVVADVSDPNHPQLLGSLEIPGQSQAVDVEGDFVFLMNLPQGLRVIDVSTPAEPRLVGSLTGGGFDLTVSGGLAMSTSWTAGLRLTDVSDPSNPTPITNVHSLQPANGVAFDPDTNTAWVASTALVEGFGLDCLTPDCPTLTVTADPVSLPVSGSGSTITVTIEDPDGNPVSGKTLNASADTGSLSAFTDHSDGSYTATYTPGTTVGWTGIRVAITGTLCNATGFVHVTFPADPPLDGPLPPHLTVIPASAHVSGAQGTAWRTDAVLHDPGSRQASVALFFLENGRDSSATAGKVVAVSAGSSLTLNDLVHETFGRSASGAILVASDEPLLVTSRTYNNVPAGTYGQFVPGLPLAEAIASGENVRLLQLTRNGHFRTNIGFANASGSPLHVKVELFKADGTPIASPTYTIPPWSFYQKTRILTADVDDAYAIVSSDDPAARYFTYASVVDNDSGDPTFVQAVPATGDVIFVSASAHLKGAAGTNWKTDCEFHNPGASDATFTVAALRRDQANISPPSAVFTLGAGRSLRLADILDSVFHITGAAALRITPSSGTLMVTSRTYNDVPAGTYGQFIPGIPKVDGTTIVQGAWLLRLSQSSNGSQGFRTNIGLTNLNTRTTEVSIGLYDANGTQLGTVEETLESYEFVQIDKIFQKVTLDAVDNGYAIVSSSTQGAAFFAYASVVDNRSGDPVYIPALR